MKKKLFFLYFFVSIFIHDGVIQSYNPICTFTPDLGGLCNNPKNNQPKFQSAFAQSQSHLNNVSPQVNPILHRKASKEKKKAGLIVSFVRRIFGWETSNQEHTLAQQSSCQQPSRSSYYPSPLLINLTQEPSHQLLQQSSATLPATPEISTQVLRNLQKNNTTACAANNISNDQEFKNIMLKRGQALEKSVHSALLPQLQHKRCNTQTAGFLQAHNIALQPFEQLTGLPIQHQLTAELIDVIDHLATYATTTHALHDTHLIVHCAHLAAMTQESNIQGSLQQAVQGTNCCHGLDHYLQGMIAAVGQQYEKFQTAFHYFQRVLQEYALAIEQSAVQSLAMLTGLEAMATVGLAAAPTATVAAGGMMLAATAYVMAPVCLQAAIDSLSFGAACIQGDWDKVAQDLDDFKTFVSSPQTVGHIAGLATGAVTSAPHVNMIMDHLLSLRPVITRVQQASGQAISQFYVMSKQQAAAVYEQSLQLLQLPEFVNFNVDVQTILGSKFFTLIEQDQCALMPAFALGLENNLLASADQAVLTQLYNQSNASIVADTATVGVSSIAAHTIIEQNYAFLQTDIGQKMYEVMIKPPLKSYEATVLSNVAKQYEKLIIHQAPQDVIDAFSACHEKSLVPDHMTQQFEYLHERFKDKYLGLPEFNAENPYLVMQMRHIFYPSIQPKLEKNYQAIEKFVLNGFHHDQDGVLEQSGMFHVMNKVYGQADFGAEECFAGNLDWGDGIVTDELKTFFPQSWSQEKVAQVIFEASSNRVEEIIMKNTSQKRFECLGLNNLIIEIIFNNQNYIISAYPSIKNFIK